MDSNGDNLGVISTREALNRAKAQGLDLVAVSVAARPVVCKILDYGKYKYELGKQKKESKKKTQETKGIKIRPSTAEHDLGFLLKNATKFIEEGDKVRVLCQFRVRELAHPEIGQRKLIWFAEKLAEIATVEKPPALEGRQMTMILLPKGASGKKNAKDQDE